MKSAPLFRKVIFWLHLIAGVFAGLVILVMAVTGVALTYERQMIDKADRPAMSAPAKNTPRLSPSQMLEKARAAAPTGASLSALTLRSDQTVPAQAVYGREASAWLHPWTGEKLESGAPGMRRFFRTATDLHRWLAASGDSRATGKAITGAANLAFLFLVVSGLYLWFPRQWSWKTVRPAFWFRRKLSGRARDWNWHNVLGFWSAIPLFFIVVTGSLISYPWATALFYRAFGETPPPSPAAAASPQGPRSSETPPAPLSPPAPTLDAAWAKAEELSPGWETISLRVPATKEAVFTVLAGHRGRPDLRSTLTLDPQTAAVLKTETFDQFSTARQARTWGRWIHTGEAGGVAGQTIAGLASAAAVILVWTGFALAIRRLVRRLKGRDANQAAAPEPA